MTKRIETLIERKIRREMSDDIKLDLIGGLPPGYCLEKEFDWKDGSVNYMSKIYINSLGIKISEIYKVTKR